MTNLVVKLRERRGHLCKPEWKHGLDRLAAGHAGERVEKLPHGDIAVGEDVALALFALLRRRNDAVRDIPHIHKVISALDARSQRAVEVANDHLGQVAVAVVIGSDDAGGMDNRGVESRSCRVQHDLRRGGLRLGVEADHSLRLKAFDLVDDVAMRKLRQRVHRADVDELFDVVLLAEAHDVVRAVNIDVDDPLIILGCDGNDARAVDEVDLILRLEPVKQRLHGRFVPHVAAHDGHRVAVEHRDILVGLRESAHRLSRGEKLPRDGVAQMSADAGDHIYSFHQKLPRFHGPAARAACLSNSYAVIISAYCYAGFTENQRFADNFTSFL